jgi:hypothetical protein
MKNKNDFDAEFEHFIEDWHWDKKSHEFGSIRISQTI